MNDQLDNRQSVEILDLPKLTSPTGDTQAHAAPARSITARPVATRTAREDNDADDEDDGFISRHRIKLTVLVVVAVGGLITWFILQPKPAPTRKAAERMVMIQPLPPPPAPPPPPPPPKVQPPEEKMIEQTPLEEKPPEPEPKPLDEPPPILGTNIKGDGPSDGFGLGTSGNGGGLGGNGLGGNGRRGGKWDSYARQVQSAIMDSLRKNPRSRAASISGLQVRIWPDSTGRVSRAQLVGTTGNPSIDEAIRSEVLTGLQLHEPQPTGMPSPIVLRLNARRPN